MKNFFLIILFFIPNIILASFPVNFSISDTIKRKGKIYVLIEGSDQNNIDSNSTKINSDSSIIENKKGKQRSQRSKNILSGIGILFTILAVLVAVLIGIIIGYLTNTSWSYP
tara:strand:- start:189 stop:524 length:336 start_codon:yes stop_codon:yes gene_type:complete